MFKYFEKLIDPVAEPPAGGPPAGTRAFYWHFIRSIRASSRASC